MSGRRAISVRKQVEFTRLRWVEERHRRSKLLAVRSKVAILRAGREQNRRCGVMPTNEPSSPWTRFEDLEELNRTMAFSPLPDSDAVRLESEAREHFSDAALDRKICAVTDTWVFPKAAECIDIDYLPFAAMRAVLTGESWRTQPVVDYYNCASIDERLRGLLLSRRAFNRCDDGKVRVWVSKCIMKDLRSIETRLSRVAGRCCDWKPPRFSIADGFVAGVYDDIDHSNCIERQAVGLVQIRGVVKVVYGGPGNVLNSHLLCWDNRNATIASRVPNVVTRANFQLILAGPMTTPQELLLAKRHECNGARVQQLHQLLRRVNPLYSDIDIDAELQVRDVDASAISTRLYPDSTTDQLIADARARQSSVARAQGEASESADCECTVVESQTVLLETTTDRNEHDRLNRAIENATGVTNTFVVRRSGSLLQTSDPYYLERLFPHLLTFGIGGFSTPRSHQYSARAIILHYLNVSSNRFAEDPLFKLVVFDYLSMKRVKTGVFLRVGQDPSLATTAMHVTPTQLKVAMQNRTDQRNAWKKGRVFVPVVEARQATTLLKSINASTSKMWGSNEEREAMTRKVDAMTIRYGAPSVFWTLTPNPDCSMTCAFWSGQPLPRGRPSTLMDCVQHNMPCSAEMTKLIMTNTVVQAQYYQICCHLLIDVLFGWDTASNKPKSQRGIFGHVETLVYALEQQGRLFVHHHGVAWIAGLPKTQSDWDQLLASDVHKERFERYCASIFSSELPVYDSIFSVLCPQSGCDGALMPVAIPKKFKHVLKSSVPAPIVATCNACDKDFTEPAIVSAIIDEQWNTLSDDLKAISSHQAVAHIRQRFGGLSSDARTANVQLSRLLLKDQVHAWAHTRSCVKGSRSSKCRYNFYRDIVDATGFNGDDEIVYKRRLGNQFLNTYIRLWRRILHFNMDARMLWSGHCLQATRYALQYTMKRQTVLDNVAVVELAFKRRVDRETSLNTSLYARGVGRLMSLAYSTSGVMEIGGPLATAIVLEGKAVTFGCEFERLILLEGLNLMSNLQVEAAIVTRNHEMFTETSIAKYIGRPKCMESYCWYEFCSWFHRIGPTTTGRPESCTFVAHNRQDIRDHVLTHNYRHRAYPHVPEIIGPRLSDATRLGNEDYADQTELYYRVSALLYCPFRNVHDFLDSENSAHDHFVRWNPSADAVTARALEHHQQHYIGLAMAQEYRDRQRAAPDESSDDENISLDDDVLHEAIHGNETMPATEYYAIPADLYSADLNDDTHGATETSRIDDAELTTVQRILFQSITSSPLPVDDTKRLTANAGNITRKQVLDFATHGPAHPTTPDQRTAVAAGAPTVVVEAFERAVHDLAYQQSRPVPAQLNSYASIQDVSAYFTLNERQHVAFSLIAVPLLSKITGLDTPQPHAHLFSTDPIIITGAGGSGKSQIIAAVRTLCTAWARPTAVAVVASTGIAAASLQGVTMHSSVGLGINLTHLPKHIESPSDAMLRQWAPVICVIADEVSMVNLSFFSLWEESLRHVKDDLDTPYGGLLPVLMFDHCQLKAVSGLPMFKTRNGDEPLSPAQERGCRLYRGITKAVYLTENMRFLGDSQWGDWLQSGRLGNWPSSLRSFIDELPTVDAHQSISHHGIIQTISTDNATRSIINEMATGIAVGCLGDDHRIYVVPARLSRRVSPIEMGLIRQLPDNKTGDIPVFLQLYIGMPVRVKANQCLSKGVANGASGVIYHLDWDTDTTFSLQQDGKWLASSQPRNLYVDITHCPSPTPFPSLPPHWPHSVMPIIQTTGTVSIRGPRLSIKGYPVVPAFGTTVHGVQGETRDAVAISHLRPPHVGKVDPHALYVALSRLRTRYGLYWIGERPTAADYDFFRPSSEVLLEDDRLRHLSHTTLAAFARLLLP